MAAIFLTPPGESNLEVSLADSLLTSSLLSWTREGGREGGGKLTLVTCLLRHSGDFVTKYLLPFSCFLPLTDGSRSEINEWPEQMSSWGSEATSETHQE